MKKPASIFNARKRSLRRLCFYTCLSFCSEGGGCLGPGPGWRLRDLAGGGSRPTPRDEVGGSGWGGGNLVLTFSRQGKHREFCGTGKNPGPHPGGVQAHTGGWWCIPACTEADPPSRHFKKLVCMLLCI